MHTVASTTDLETALRAPVALLYKHSDTCPISAMAHREIANLAADHPELPVYVVNVHAQRAIARDIAERFTIRHESPQVILLRDGAPVWHASHYGVTARAVEHGLHEHA